MRGSTTHRDTMHNNTALSTQDRNRTQIVLLKGFHFKLCESVMEPLINKQEAS